MALNKVSTSLHYVKRPQSSSLDSSETYWVPNTDVYVTEGGLVIKVELAGMRKEDLEVLMVDSNRLKISGHRPDGCRAPKCTFLVMEINYGAFESIIEVPSAYDLGQARAAYQNGFLRIDVPEHVKSSHKPIPVSVLSGEG